MTALAPVGALPRRLLIAALATLIALGLVAAPPAAREVEAALPGLTLVTNARYDVQPDERRVRVTVDIVATNRLKDTATRRFYFDRAFLAVLPGATAFRLTSDAGNPSVRVSQRRATHQVLALSFGRRILAGRSARFRLTFNLPDPGGAATRDVRIGQALVQFPVWAYASNETPGSTVTVVFPKGFNVQLEAGSFPEPKTDDQGRIVYSSGKLDDPLRFFAYFVADRPASYEERKLSTRVGDRDAQLTVRHWADDPDWAERVTGLLDRGLPELQKLIGLPWPREEALTVEESVSRTTGGYAGLFDPSEGRIEIAYYADAFIVLHEGAHAWFNGNLLADRWANEAFASYYAQSAGGRLGEKITVAELTDELREAAFPLNAWAPAGQNDGTEEDYGYAAAIALAREVAKRAGHEGLRGVWAAAAARAAAYQPPRVDPGAAARPPELAEAPPDWRGLLDLLEDRTGQRYDDLWREWVVRDGEAALLDERETARAEYERVVRAAGRWELPASVRSALRAWRFDEAMTLLADAETVLERRSELEAAAAAAGLRVPTRVETAFEAGPGFETALAEADATEAAMDIVTESAAAQPAQADLLQQVGLIGTQPEAQLAAAREAFARGELQQSAEQAVAAMTIWQTAADVGRNRILISLGIALLVLLGVAFLVSRVLDRRRRRRQRADEAPAATAPSERSEPPSVA